MATIKEGSHFVEEIRVTYKQAFGKTFFYAENEQAKLWLKLLRKETFTKTDLKLIREIGVKIVVDSPDFQDL